jgi:hypothetical protein
MALVSSLEMVAFWALAIRFRRRLWSVLRSWRTSRLLRLVIPFALFYILMIGISFQNLGIIARQRALVMPALLLVLAEVSAAQTRRVAVASPQRGRRLWNTPTPALAPAGRPS